MLFAMMTGLVGLMFGSFANVCVHRIPRNQSVITPRSRCPACGSSISWYDNIPILSWLLLGGRCRSCKTRISLRYPVLELLMGASWAALAQHFGPTLHLVQALVLVSLLWILSLIDLETGYLPDVLTFPGMAMGLGFSAMDGYFVDALIGMLAGYGFFWLVARIFLLATGKEGMGYGDFKLLAMLGAFMGWQALPFIVLVASFSGAVLGSVVLLLAKRGLRAEIPFGPYLAAGGMIWFLWSEPILSWYGNWIGLSVVGG